MAKKKASDYTEQVYDNQIVLGILDEINERYNYIALGQQRVRNNTVAIIEQNKKLLKTTEDTSQQLNQLRPSLAKIKSDFKSLNSAGKSFAKSLGIETLQKSLGGATVQSKLMVPVMNSIANATNAVSKNVSVLGTNGFQSARKQLEDINSQLDTMKGKLSNMYTENELKSLMDEANVLSFQLRGTNDWKQTLNQDVIDAQSSMQQMLKDQQKRIIDAIKKGIKTGIGKDKTKEEREQILNSILNSDKTKANINRALQAVKKSKEFMLRQEGFQTANSQLARLNSKEQLQALQDKQSKLDTINQALTTAVKVTEDQKKNYQQAYAKSVEQKNALEQTVNIQQQLNSKLKPWFDGIDKVTGGMDKVKNTLADIGGGIPLISDAIKSISFSKIGDNVKKVISQFMMGIRKSDKGFKGLFQKIGVGFKSIFKILGSIAIGLAGIIVGMLLGGLAIAMDRFQQMQRWWMNARRNAGSIMGQKANFGAIVGTLGGQFGQGDAKAASLYKTMNKLRDVTVQTARYVQILDRKFMVSADSSSALLQNLRYGYGASQRLSGRIGILVANMAVMQGIQPQKVIEQMAEASGEVFQMFGRSKKTLVSTVMYAKKMNTSLAQMAKTAKGFLDIQKMIEDSMQIQLLTNKQLDVGRIVSLTAQGKSAEATALAFDQLGSAMLSTNPIISQKVASFLNMDVKQLRYIGEQMNRTGKSATQILSQLQQRTSANMTQTAVTGLQGLHTQAAGYKTAMQLFGIQMRNMIYRAFGPLVDWLYQNLFSTKTVSKLQPLFKFFNKLSKVIVVLLDTLFSGRGLRAMSPLLSSIGGVLSEIFQKVVSFLGNREAMAKIGEFIKQAWQYLKKLGPILQKAFATLWKGIKWVIDFIDKHPKGALATALGLGALIVIIPKVAASLRFLMIINLIRNIFGLTSITIGGTFVKAISLAGKALWSLFANPVGLAILAVAALAAGVYLLYKALNPDPMKKWAKQLQININGLKSEIEAQQTLIDVMSSGIEKKRDAINTYRELSRKTNLNAIQTDQLKNSYVELLGREAGLKAFYSGQKLSIDQLRQAQEDLMRKQKQKYDQQKRLSLLKLKLLSSQLDMKIALQTFQDSTAVGRLLKLTANSLAWAELGPIIRKAQIDYASGNPSQAIFDMQQALNRYKNIPRQLYFQMQTMMVNMESGLQVKRSVQSLEDEITGRDIAPVQDRGEIQLYTPWNRNSKHYEGGIAPGRELGHNVIIGERNQDEAVLPLPEGIRSFLSELKNYRTAANSNGEGTLTLNLTTNTNLNVDGTPFATYVANKLIQGAPYSIVHG